MQRTDGIKRLRDTAFDLFGFESHVRGTEGHVFFDSGHEKLIVRILKHQSHRLSHQRQRLACERDPTHHYCALRRHQQPVDVQQQG